MIFCDTSALAKFYVPEAESLAIRKRLEAEDEVSVSELARVELMAVFHRRLREGRWSQAAFRAAVNQFNHDDIGAFWTWVPVDGVIMQNAARVFTTLSPKIFLRSSDCIHLVTALRHNFTEICTYDSHQAEACVGLGLFAVRI